MILAQSGYTFHKFNSSSTNIPYHTELCPLQITKVLPMGIKKNIRKRNRMTLCANTMNLIRLYTMPNFMSMHVLWLKLTFISGINIKLLQKNTTTNMFVMWSTNVVICFQEARALVAQAYKHTETVLSENKDKLQMVRGII